MMIIWRPEWGEYPFPAWLINPENQLVAPLSVKELEDFWPDLADLPDGNDPFPHLAISGTDDKIAIAKKANDEH